MCIYTQFLHLPSHSGLIVLTGQSPKLLSGDLYSNRESMAGELEKDTCQEERKLAFNLNCHFGWEYSCSAKNCVALYDAYLNNYMGCPVELLNVYMTDKRCMNSYEN